MEQRRYERPREKVLNRGVASLSTVELLQLVIGTGGMKVSAAKLARSVEELLRKGEVTYQSLIKLDGMGVAKTCQILATLELARRL